LDWISAAGEALPIQCAYAEKSGLSVPTDSATNRKQCDAANLAFVFSGKRGNHWSNQKTMREWINDVRSRPCEDEEVEHADVFACMAPSRGNTTRNLSVCSTGCQSPARLRALGRKTI
jgi:hypothetical protein